MKSLDTHSHQFIRNLRHIQREHKQARVLSHRNAASHAHSIPISRTGESLLSLMKNPKLSLYSSGKDDDDEMDPTEREKYIEFRDGDREKLLSQKEVGDFTVKGFR